MVGFGLMPPCQQFHSLLVGGWLEKAVAHSVPRVTFARRLAGLLAIGCGDPACGSAA